MGLSLTENCRLHNYTTKFVHKIKHVVDENVKKQGTQDRTLGDTFGKSFPGTSGVGYFDPLPAPTQSPSRQQAAADNPYACSFVTSRPCGSNRMPWKDP